MLETFDLEGIATLIRSGMPPIGALQKINACQLAPYVIKTASLEHGF